MARKYNGIKTKIKKKNNLATFILCTAHCINLTSVNAVIIKYTNAFIVQ